MQDFFILRWKIIECNIEELNIRDLKETLELVKKVFMEFEAPDYNKEGIKFIPMKMQIQNSKKKEK